MKHAIQLATIILLFSNCDEMRTSAYEGFSFNVKSVSIDVYRPEERGKFLNICFSEVIEDRETIFIEYLFTSSSGEQCKFESSIYGHDSKCERLNVFSVLQRRHSSEYEVAFVRNQINQGNISNLKLSVFEEYNDALLFEGAFENL